MNIKETRNSRLGARMVKNLERRHFEAHYCPTCQEAIELINSLIADGSSVTWGGSMTIRDIMMQLALYNVLLALPVSLFAALPVRAPQPQKGEKDKS